MTPPPETELRELLPEERTLYFRGVQGIWGGGLSEDKFVAFQHRLAASPEAAGRYRMLGLFPRAGGELLAAMKVYELAASSGATELRVLGIGAVFTPPARRRRGHAAQMLARAMEQFAADGWDAALLFSDIGADYYARLGFRSVESVECSADLSELPRASGYRPAARGDEAQMSALFEGGRGRERFSLSRDGWALRFQLRRLRELARARNVGEPEWGLVVEGGRGGAAAMIRLGREAVDVLEAAWTTEAARERLFGGLRDLLVRAGRPRLRIWPCGQLRGLFAAVPRSTAIAMVAPLREGVPLPAADEPAELSLLDHI